MSATPPGWYDDGHGARRWWDGAQWTEHVQPADPAAPTAPAAPTSDAPAAQAFAATSATTTDAAPATWTAGSGATAAGYPGAAQYPAYPPVAPVKKKSNLWIVWVVLGVLALGAVITAVIVIPMLLVGVFSQSGSSNGGTGTLSADETAAVETVQLYDQAWQEVDCDLYFAVTTEAFREDEVQLPDCESFTETAQFFADSNEDYVVAITDVWTDDDVIMVTTDETYTTLVDDEGEPLAEPEDRLDQWEYYLIDSGDAWVIDDGAANE